MLTAVPWVNRRELGHVFEELYSCDMVQQKHAVGRVAVWKSRVLNKLPVALESTAAFVNAVMTHQRASLSGEIQDDDLQLRTLYSLSLIRFVNHITEKGQSRLHAVPLQVLAAELGVPEWMVDLRHEATHGTMPSLPILKVAATWALAWLKKEFWEKQLDVVVEKSSDPERSEMNARLDCIRDLMVAYQQQKFKECSSQSDVELESVQMLKDLETLLVDAQEAAIPCLVTDGYMVPTEDQLKALGIKVNEFLDNNDASLPSTLNQFWRPVLQQLDSLDLTSHLLHHILLEVTEETSLRNKLLYGWVGTVIQQSDIGKDLLHQKLLIGKITKVKNQLCIPLIKMLLARLEPSTLPVERKELLLKAITTYNGARYHGTSSATGRLHTIQDACNQLGLKVCNTQETAIPLQSSWQQCSDIVDWSRYPVGVLSGQKLGHRTLELHDCISSPCNSDGETALDESQSDISDSEMMDVDTIEMSEGSSEEMELPHLGRQQFLSIKVHLDLL